MKPKTDPQTGETRAELTKPERCRLAGAKDVLLQIAYIEEPNHYGCTAKALADDIGGILAGVQEAINDSDPRDETQTD